MQDALNQLYTSKPDAIFMIAAVLLLPWIMGIINRQRWRADIKSAMVVLACGVVTALWLVFHEFSDVKWVVYAGILIGGTQLVYFFFKPGVKEIESRTG